jgi:hypothetical protein
VSTESKDITIPPVPVDSPLSLRELGVVLIKHYQLHEGLFNPMIEFHVGIGPVGPNPESLSPGAMIAISRIGLMPAQLANSAAIDAAEVNPEPKKGLGRTLSTARKPKKIASKRTSTSVKAKTPA